MKGEKIEELWDIYDADRVMTGKKHRRGEPMVQGEYHVVVYVCIFNHKNQLLIQHRQPWKLGWPNMWDLTVGGSAVAGDTSQVAAMREVKEEIGLDLDLNGVRPHFTINAPTAIVDFYMITKDIDIAELKLQEEEVKEVKWVTHEELMQMVADGIMIPHYFLNEIFDIKNQYGSKIRSVNGISIQKAQIKNIISWMNLMEIVWPRFADSENEAAVQEYKDLLMQCIKEQTAYCAVEDARVLGVLLYSAKEAKIKCLAVHPEFRGQKIASRLLKQMQDELKTSVDCQAVIEEFMKKGQKEE